MGELKISTTAAAWQVVSAVSLDANPLSSRWDSIAASNSSGLKCRYVWNLTSLAL